MTLTRRKLKNRDKMAYGDKIADKMAHGDKMQQKGGNFINVDLKAIEEKFEKLKEFHNVPIALLQNEYKIMFDDIRETVRLLYNHESYNALFSLAEKYYGDLKEVIPRTVGSYFIGCLVSTNITKSSSNLQDGCSLICSNAMPKPRSDNDWSFCNHSVIWCNKNQTFKFIFLSYIPKNDRGIIFVNYNTYDEFPGFIQEEKKELLDKGIKSVKLLSYNKNGTVYIDLLDAPIDVEKIKVRDANTKFNNETIVEKKVSRLHKKWQYAFITIISLIVLFVFFSIRSAA